MKGVLILLVSILIIQESVAPPVDKKQKKEKETENEVEETEELADVMEYHRYLQEVVQALESDPQFRSKLEKADEKDIRNGNIADELEYVNHHVRTKLDELKRAELERLRHLAVKEFELENGLDPTHLKILEHVDHDNPHTFEIDDLKKLIAKTTKDLDEADKRRREEFKHYEMNKKFEQEEKMKNMTEEERKKYENELHDLEKKHKDHEPLHHPGSKKQLEEVWEKQDHMDQQFDPRTFFYLHDLDGNGVWDQTEIKALFIKELDKLYAEGHPEDDLVERAEEMERMREHVIKEADLNKDGLISYDEFLNESKKAEFEQDPGWKPLDEEQIYSEQEYETYRRQKAQEIEQAIARSMSQQHHAAGLPQGVHPQFPSHPNQIPQQGYGHQPQYQIPQHQYPPHQAPQHQQYPPQGQYMNQMPPQHGQQFNQMPPQHGQQFNQMPPQQGQQFNQMPPQHGQQFNQMPPQHGQQFNQVLPQHGQQFNQVPPQHEQYQQASGQHDQHVNQIPQQQYHPNQQVPISNNINQVPQQQNYPNQQVPINQNQVPSQQHHQESSGGQNANQIPQQHNLPAGQQQNQQQNPPTGQQQNPPTGQQQNQQQNPPTGQQQNQQQNPPTGQQQNPPTGQQQNLPAGQQQNQQHQYQNQQPQVGNQVPQQVNNHPAEPHNLPNQQNPAAIGQRRHDTQNQVPQQNHEQIVSINNAHHNEPNVVKP